jgi:hypothetical protein
MIDIRAVPVLYTPHPMSPVACSTGSLDASYAPSSAAKGDPA